MTASELRSLLLIAFNAILGQYTRAGHSPLPAIWVGARTPPGWSVSGLEVIIFRTPEPVRNTEFFAVNVTQRRRVVLRQHDENKSLEEPNNTLLKLFPDAPAPTVVPESDVTILQSTFLLPFTEDL